MQINTCIFSKMKNDDFPLKTKNEIPFFWVGGVFHQYQHKIQQIFTDVSYILIRTHSRYRIALFLITLSECNKILSFVSSFPFNDAMKYASNACYLPAINVHVSFFFLLFPFSNNLTLIDSVVYYFMTR